jgi:esterase FrsA
MFVFPVETEDWFEERTSQFISLGIPRKVVNSVRAKVSDPWADEPGGWVYEWSQAAERARSEGDHLLAVHCYGAAKFPTLNTPSREAAFAKQLDEYKIASRRFKPEFRRQTVAADYRRGTTAVPVHVFRRRRRRLNSLLVLTGGVDTLKMDLHFLANMIAQRTGLTVAAMDMPGTGESEVALAQDADEIYASVAQTLRSEFHADRVGIFGLSFGGHWAAKLAITRAVDAAIDLGGPVGANQRDGAKALQLPNGMAGIVGNALKLDGLPDEAGVATILSTFSLGEQGLLDNDEVAPLLAVNGDLDEYVPLEDTLVFAGQRNTTAWVVKNTTHCAVEKIQPVGTAAVAWMVNQLLDGNGWRFRAAAARMAVRPLMVRNPQQFRPEFRAQSLTSRA